MDKIKSIIEHSDTKILGFFHEYRFLSNYHVCEIWDDGLGYSSTEAAYQAAKVPLEERKIFTKLSPSESKKLGQKIKISEDWNVIKFDVMSRILYKKFTKHEYLKELLLATGDKYLEETNYWNDTIWGTCRGEGENRLGKLLMEVRHFLQNEEYLKK